MRIILAAAILLSGCAAVEYTPATEAGGQCKMQCGVAYTHCTKDCTKSLNICHDACRDVDRLDQTKIAKR